MHTLIELADFLAAELKTDRYPATEQGGIYGPSDRPVARLGLALEPFPGLRTWVETARLDALWLHRPWQLDLTTLPPDIGILTHHLPFDEILTMGVNPYLSRRLNAFAPPRPLGYKHVSADGLGASLPPRPIGMLIDVPACEFDALLRTVSTDFVGYDRAELGRQDSISRIAVMGAMTDQLVREVASQGAHLYLTGQYRKPAQEAVDETGLAVIAVGHRRTEAWGLGALAHLLHERWPNLQVVH